MVKIVVEKLIHCLRAHNQCYIAGVSEPHNETEINLLFTLLEKYGVGKTAIVAKSYDSEKRSHNVLEHASNRMGCEWGYWFYESISLDFTKVAKELPAEYDNINFALCHLGFVLNDAVATYEF